MARYYTGDHPCPGCGEKKNRTGKYEICYDCTQALKVGYKIQNDKDKSDPDGFCAIHIERYAFQGEYVLRTYFQGYNSPPSEILKKTTYINYFSDDGKPYNSRIIRNILQDILKKINVGPMKYSHIICPASSTATTFGEDKVIVPIKFAIPIIELFDYIGNAAEGLQKDFYDKGKRDGANLLAGLNSGEISLKSLETHLKDK